MGFPTFEARPWLTITFYAESGQSLVAVPGYMIIVCGGISHGAAQSHISSGLKFDFGPGKVAPKYKQVLATTLYNEEQGYGFEPGSPVICLDRGSKSALRSDICTSDKPFYFSVALPEGNYSVRVILGDDRQATVTTVKAELRRLMIERVETARGEFATCTFAVNIRTPKIPGGGEVRLKEREKTAETWAWDEKLTLEFNNSRPSISAIEITRADDLPTVYLLGDSTVCDQPSEPYNSWGQYADSLFQA